ncbi:MAG: hypothetical protein AAFU49_22690 [Pseudomonadota bacterium]
MIALVNAGNLLMENANGESRLAFGEPRSEHIEVLALFTGAEEAPSIV